jgi:RNA polymerase sigma-70 factor (ECF subfamily)
MNYNDQANPIRLFSASKGELEELYRQSLPRVIRVLRAMRVREEDVDDIAQEVFLHVFQSSAVFENYSYFAAFLRVTARNVVISKFRHRMAVRRSWPEGNVDHMRIDELSLIDSSMTPEESLSYKEAILALLKEMESLPPRMLEVLRMFLRGMKIQEIARTMKIEAGTVKSHLHRARESLKASMMGKL